MLVLVVTLLIRGARALLKLNSPLKNSLFTLAAFLGLLMVMVLVSLSVAPMIILTVTFKLSVLNLLINLTVV